MMLQMPGPWSREMEAWLRWRFSDVVLKNLTSVAKFTQQPLFGLTLKHQRGECGFAGWSLAA